MYRTMAEIYTENRFYMAPFPPSYEQFTDPNPTLAGGTNYSSGKEMLLSYACAIWFKIFSQGAPGSLGDSIPIRFEISKTDFKFRRFWNNRFARNSLTTRRSEFPTLSVSGSFYMLHR